MSGPLRRASKAGFLLLDVLARPLPPPRVLIYHQIGGGSGLEMEVPPDSFRRQLGWLAENFSIQHLSDAVNEPASDSVVLTFDDGYRSLFEVAYPLLYQRRIPFTLYLTTEPVEEERPMRAHAGADPLTWEMIRQMRDSGLATIGAHTHTHPDLRTIEPSALEAELDRSDEIIERRLGVKPVHFAYPWGYWSPTADIAVRRRYETAALGSRLPRQQLSDAHLLHRIPVQLSDGIRWFPARVNRGLLFEEWARRRLKGYRGH